MLYIFRLSEKTTAGRRRPAAAGETPALLLKGGPMDSLNLEWLSILMTRELSAFSRELDLFEDESLIWSTVPGIANSAGNLTLHVCGNLQHFVGATLGGTGYVRDREREFSARGIGRAELQDQRYRPHGSIRTLGERPQHRLSRASRRTACALRSLPSAPLHASRLSPRAGRLSSKAPHRREPAEQWCDGHSCPRRRATGKRLTLATERAVVGSGFSAVGCRRKTEALPSPTPNPCQPTPAATAGSRTPAPETRRRAPPLARSRR